MLTFHTLSNSVNAPAVVLTLGGSSYLCSQATARDLLLTASTGDYHTSRVRLANRLDLVIRTPVE